MTKSFSNTRKKRLTIGAFFVSLMLLLVNQLGILSDENTLADLVAEQQSGVMIRLDGEVIRLLEQDNIGRRHQRFILKHRDFTVLVAHNIDLARPVPLSVGDQVTVYGQYEWNPQGGVIHWTHDDPQGERDGGWIKHDNQTYGTELSKR